MALVVRQWHRYAKAPGIPNAKNRETFQSSNCFFTRGVKAT
jgi:hypothetical protein